MWAAPAGRTHPPEPPVLGEKGAAGRWGLDVSASFGEDSGDFPSLEKRDPVCTAGVWVMTGPGFQD